MLQNLRDNLKGSVAIFVILIFVVPLVLFGVEQLFVGSAGQKDVAKVNGEGISTIDFRRELEMEKQRLVQQFGVEPDSPQLEDRNLREPVLQRMVQRLVLQQEAEEGGLGVSRDALWKEIAAVEAFQVDGKFDYEVFKQRISQIYTPAQYLDALAGDFLISQLEGGISGTAFVTEAELALIAAITQQQRSFYTIRVPQPDESSVVTDAQITEFYEANQQRFTEPESVQVAYIELDLDDLAQGMEPSESEIRDAYEAEVQEFESAPRYEIAHILLDAEQEDAQVKEVHQRILEGADFAELAKQHSADLGSKESGGYLGELDLAVFPETFTEAVSGLQVGEVSEPVTTESGIHFIKLLGVSNQEPPTFEERKEAIAAQLSRSMAQDEYVKKIAELDEQTFGKADLRSVAERLGLTFEESEPFTRSSGAGIGESAKVREAAFSQEVLREGYNSRVLELPDDRAIVLHVEKHTPEQVKPLDLVREEIEQQLESELRTEMMLAEAEKIKSRLRNGENPERLASAAGYEYRFFDKAERGTMEIDMAVAQKAFSLPRPGSEQQLVVDHAQRGDGGIAIVGLTDVSDGSVEQMTEAQLASTRNQLRNQTGQSEMMAFERSVMERAKVRASD